MPRLAAQNCHFCGEQLQFEEINNGLQKVSGYLCPSGCIDEHSMKCLFCGEPMMIQGYEGPLGTTAAICLSDRCAVHLA